MRALAVCQRPFGHPVAAPCFLTFEVWMGCGGSAAPVRHRVAVGRLCNAVPLSGGRGDYNGP